MQQVRFCFVYLSPVSAISGTEFVLPVVNVILIYEEYVHNRGGYAFYNVSEHDSRCVNYSSDI